MTKRSDPAQARVEEITSEVARKFFLQTGPMVQASKRLASMPELGQMMHKIRKAEDEPTETIADVLNGTS